MKLKANFSKISSNNRVEFYTEGKNYYERYLEMIRTARISIYLQTYIFHVDNLFGSSVHEALVHAALRGVKVYVLVDSVGSRLLSQEAEHELINAGVVFCRFNRIKFKWLGQWGRRLHHKILLTDQSHAMVGGINILSDSYGMEAIKPVLDFAVLLQGEAVKGLVRYCENIFTRACQKKIIFNQKLQTEISQDEYNIKLRISVNDWMLGRFQITKQYNTLVSEAKQSITIINSYFFPRLKFMRQLVDAANRGVKVRLILPKYSDWPSWVLATQYLYYYFLKNGVEVYQWRDSIMHGKLATVDGQYTTIGSFNLNYTSYQQNLEMNVDILSEEFTHALDLKIADWIGQSCEKIEMADLDEKASLKVRFLRILYYSLLSIIASFSIALSFGKPKSLQER